MLDDNLIVKKSYNFTLMIIELYKYLSIKKREYVLSKQLLTFKKWDFYWCKCTGITSRY